MLGLGLMDIYLLFPLLHSRADFHQNLQEVMPLHASFWSHISLGIIACLQYDEENVNFWSFTFADSRFFVRLLQDGQIFVIPNFHAPSACLC
jgi:hypothetical protein